MLFPNVVVHLPDEPPEAHPDVLNPVREAKASHAVIDPVMAIAEELSQILVISIPISVNHTVRGYGFQDEGVGSALCTVWNAFEDEHISLPL